jgi:hypothetical protein
MGCCEVVVVAVGGHIDCDPRCMMLHWKAFSFKFHYGVKDSWIHEKGVGLF